MKKTIRIIPNTVLVFLILLGLIIAVSLLPIKNNFHVFSVMSGSMEPSFPVGSLIFSKPAKEYRVGDVITFRTTSDLKKFITHRVHSISYIQGVTKYQTKGDANNAPDAELVEGHQVFGKAFMTVALIGYLLAFVKTLPGLILIIVIPSTIIIYEESKKIHHETKKIIHHRLKKKEEAKALMKKVKKVARKKGVRSAKVA